MVIKTACSSAGIGLHEALEAIRQEKITSAVITGSNLILGEPCPKRGLFLDHRVTYVVTLPKKSPLIIYSHDSSWVDYPLECVGITLTRGLLEIF